MPYPFRCWKVGVSAQKCPEPRVGFGFFSTAHLAITDVWLFALRACNISEGLATILHDCLKSILSRRDMTLITPYKAAGRNMGWKTIVTLAAVHYRLASNP